MKKKLLMFTVVATMMLGVVGCGKKDEANTGSSSASSNSTAASNNSANTTVEDNNSAADATDDFGLGYTTEEEYVVFSVRNDFVFDSDGWLGVIPTGTIYEKEADADEYDIIYTYCDNYDAENPKEFIFKFNKEYFFGIDDGVYDMVLCSSDDAEKGVVLFQVGIEKSGMNFSFDYENKQ